MPGDTSKSIKFDLELAFQVSKASTDKMIGEMGSATKKVMDDVSKIAKPPTENLEKETKEFVNKINKDFPTLFDKNRFKSITDYVFGELGDSRTAHSKRNELFNEIDKTIKPMLSKYSELRNTLKQGVEGGVISMPQAQGLYDQTINEENLRGMQGEIQTSRDAASENVRKVMGSHQTKKHVSVIGAYVLGYLVSNLIQQFGQLASQETLMGAQIGQRTALGFDMSGIMQNRVITTETAMGNQMQRMEFANRQRQVLYSTGGAIAGSVLGGIAGSFIGNPMMGAALGSGVGMSLANTWAEIQGSQDIAKLTEQQTAQKERNRFSSQMLSFAYGLMPAYDQYDISKTKFRARTGTTDIGARGLGYDQGTLYQMALQQEGVTGKFNKESFEGQMKFSRAYGYDPSQIFQAGITTRYTGQQVGAEELMRRQQLAQTTGMGTRMPELIQALNQLSVMITKATGSASEEGIMRASMLPFAIYGDSAKGRLGDLGMETIASMQGMFKQETGSPQDILLYNATKNMHKGNITEFGELKAEGLGNKEMLPDLLQGMLQYSGGNKNFLKETIKEFLPDKDPIKARELYNKIYNADPNKSKEENLKDFLKKYEELVQTGMESKEAIEKLTGQSIKNTSEAEKFQEKMTNKVIEGIGKHIKELRDMQKTELDVKLNALSSGWDVITSEWRKGVEDFKLAVARFIGSQKEDELKSFLKGETWNLQTEGKSVYDPYYERSIAEVNNEFYNREHFKKTLEGLPPTTSIIPLQGNRALVLKLKKGVNLKDVPEEYTLGHNEAQQMIDYGFNYLTEEGHSKDETFKKAYRAYKLGAIEGGGVRGSQELSLREIKMLVSESRSISQLSSGDINIKVNVNVENLKENKRKILQTVESAIDEIAERAEPTKLVGSSKN